MAIVRYQPWNLLSDFQQEINKLMESQAGLENSDLSNVATSQWHPRVDIKELKNQFVILADIPGVEPEAIEVHMDNGVLEIKGIKEFEKKEEGEGFKRIERERGEFYRRFSMPDTADAEGITASSKNGVLEITIPKRKTSVARKIKVS